MNFKLTVKTYNFLHFFICLHIPRIVNNLGKHVYLSFVTTLKFRFKNIVTDYNLTLLRVENTQHSIVVVKDFQLIKRVGSLYSPFYK